jgi:hypothetical protein
MALKKRVDLLIYIYIYIYIYIVLKYIVLEIQLIVNQEL